MIRREPSWGDTSADRHRSSVAGSGGMTHHVDQLTGPRHGTRWPIRLDLETRCSFGRTRWTGSAMDESRWRFDAGVAPPSERAARSCCRSDNCRSSRSGRSRRPTSRMRTQHARAMGRVRHCAPSWQAAPTARTLYRIELGALGPDPRIALRLRSSLTDDELATLGAKLAKLDGSAPNGSWPITSPNHSPVPTYVRRRF